MRLLCPAKINLHLRVGPARGDGFHPLLSWFCTTRLFDILRVDPIGPGHGSESEKGLEQGSEDRLVSLRCDQPDLPVDRRNLVVKVAQAWGEEARGMKTAEVSPVRAELFKHIPAGAGLGGGSSDGARMLMGLNVLWRAGRAADYLSEFAARFGSDLPFFFHGPSSVCKGRGEIVCPIPRPQPRAVLLILPPIMMPTADVYRRFDAMKLGRDEDVEHEPDWLAWTTLDARSLLEKLVNDLEPPAFSISPTLANLRLTLEKSLGRPVRMSGSGSSLFTIYDTLAEAKGVGDQLKESGEFSSGVFGPVRFEAVELAPTVRDDLDHV